MLVLPWMAPSFMCKKKKDSFISQNGSIAYSYSFLSCLPCCFKPIISIWMIATVHNSHTLAEFIHICFDGFVSFCKKRRKKKRRGKKAIIKGSITILSVSRGWFLVKCFHANFTLLPLAKNTIISIFFESLHLIQTHNQAFHGTCCHKAGV